MVVSCFIQALESGQENKILQPVIGYIDMYVCTFQVFLDSYDWLIFYIILISVIKLSPIFEQNSQMNDIFLPQQYAICPYSAYHYEYDCDFGV